MIDCHCHLADEAFKSDIEQVVDRAKQAGVVSAIVVAEFPSDFGRILELSSQFPDFIHPCLGIHPVQEGHVSVTEKLYKNAGIEERIRAAMQDNQIHGIGEVGLDFTPRYLRNGDVDKQEQRAIFKAQIVLAKQFGLTLYANTLIGWECTVPLVRNVHSRSAGKPAIESLKENGAESVLLHAFSGNLKAVRQGLDAGYHFSVPPSFTMSKEKESFVREIPLNRLCLESDSPVLGPSRDERNEPANIRLCAEFIARVKGLDIAEVLRVTSENARRLFRIGAKSSS